MGARQRANERIDLREHQWGRRRRSTLPENATGQHADLHGGVGRIFEARRAALRRQRQDAEDFADAVRGIEISELTVPRVL